MPDLITVEKRYDDRLWIVSLHESSRAGVDAWEASVRDYIAHVNPALERYLVYDMTHAGSVTFTSYARTMAMKLAREYRDATGRVGLVVPTNPAMVHIFDLFLRYTSRQLQPHLDVKLFNHRDKALEWVSAILP